MNLVVKDGIYGVFVLLGPRIRSVKIVPCLEVRIAKKYGSVVQRGAHVQKQVSENQSKNVRGWSATFTVEI